MAEIEVDIDRDCAERQAAAMGVFAMGFRNGAATTGVLGKFWIEGQAAVVAPFFANGLSGRDGVALAVASVTCFWLLTEFGTKSETAALRGAVEKKILSGLGKFSRLDCTRARYAELRPIRPQGVWPFAIYARPASPTAVRVVGSGLRLPAWRAWAARGPAAASYMYI